mgnify:CR=1 FL=1
MLFGYELDALFWAMFFSFGFGFLSGSLILILLLFWWTNREEQK